MQRKVTVKGDCRNESFCFRGGTTATFAVVPLLLSQWYHCYFRGGTTATFAVVPLLLSYLTECQQMQGPRLTIIN